MANHRTEETNRQINKRLKKIEGQVRGISKMIDNNRDCLEIMHQILSVNSALKSVWEIIAASHLENCLENEPNAEKRKETVEKIIKSLKDLR